MNRAPRRNAPPAFEGDVALPDGRSVRFEAAADGGAVLRVVGSRGPGVRLRDATEEALADALAELLAAPPEAPPPFEPNFADKVETLARVINDRMRERWPGRDLGGSLVEVEPSRSYWYLRSRYGGRAWAVDVKTSAAHPVDSRGVVRALSLRLDDIGRYDWSSNRRFPPPLAAPRPVAWARSPLPPPKAEGPKRPRPEPAVRVEGAPPPGRAAPWSPPRPPPGSFARLPGVVSSVEGWEGDRHREAAGMTLAEIARLVRRDVKGALASGDLPAGLGVDVRVRHRTIVVRVARAPSSLQLVAEDGAPYVLEDPEAVRRFRPGQGRSATAEALLGSMTHMVNRYRQDRSDAQSDYFDVSFYLDVGFEPHVLLQAAYDRLWADAGGLRRDVYLERSVSEALDLGHHAGIVAYQQAGSAPGDPLLLQWVEFAPGRVAARWPGRVLAQADATRGDAPEFAVGWSREFGGP